MKGLIICGFPGVGKTTAAQLSHDVRDLESTPFHYRWDFATGSFVDKEDWVPHYIQAIEEAADCVNYVLVSTHKEVLDALEAKGLPYIIVMPGYDIGGEIKNEYIARYIRRGSPYSLIKKLYDNWDTYQRELEDRGMPTVYLGKGQTLADVLPIPYTVTYKRV